MVPWVRGELWERGEQKFVRNFTKTRFFTHIFLVDKRVAHMVAGSKKIDLDHKKAIFNEELEKSLYNVILT